MLTKERKELLIKDMIDEVKSLCLIVDDSVSENSEVIRFDMSFANEEDNDSVVIIKFAEDTSNYVLMYNNMIIHNPVQLSIPLRCDRRLATLTSATYEGLEKYDDIIFNDGYIKVSMEVDNENTVNEPLTIIHIESVKYPDHILSPYAYNIKYPIHQHKIINSNTRRNNHQTIENKIWYNPHTLVPTIFETSDCDIDDNIAFAENGYIITEHDNDFEVFMIDRFKYTGDNSSITATKIMPDDDTKIKIPVKSIIDEGITLYEDDTVILERTHGTDKNGFRIANKKYVCLNAAREEAIDRFKDYYELRESIDDTKAVFNKNNWSYKKCLRILEEKLLESKQYFEKYRDEFLDYDSHIRIILIDSNKIIIDTDKEF